jgi:hypothetical protein
MLPILLLLQLGGSMGAMDVRAGFLGTVHPSIMPAAADLAKSVQTEFGFGTAMVYNTASGEGGMSLKESVLFHCHNASVNQLSMLVAPPTEGGVISNPADNDPWEPTKTAGTGYQGNVGMVQAAARFSAMSRICPQATGIVIDDFLQQYIGKNTSGGCINATCPASQGHIYGGRHAGYYCCPARPDGGDCSAPACRKGASQKDCACCIFPGDTEGCQGASKCQGSPPNTSTICPTVPMITLQDMKEIKAAVMGKTVRTDGTVDHSSTAQTPHLTLGIVWYDFELVGNYDWLKTDGLLDVIDVVSPWVWKQTASLTSDYATQIIAKVRKLAPTLPLYAGVYIKNSAIGWTDPVSVDHILTQTAELYDQGAIAGSLIFAGVWLESDNMNASVAASYALPQLLGKTYYPHVGTATLSIVDKTNKPLAGALATVHYGGSGSSGSLVTRRISDADGRVEFGGWAGRAAAVPHTVAVTAPGYAPVTHVVQLKGMGSVKATVKLAPS